MKTITWGVLSVSDHFRKRIMPAFRRSSSMQLGAIASRSPERARAAAEEFGSERSYGSYADLLADPAIDAVYVPLPNHLHAEWVKKCADAGKPVLCEKPFAMNAADTAEAFAYARGKGVEVREAFMYPFHPQWELVSELVSNGDIGKVRAVQGFFSYDNKDAANIRNRPETGGGALYDIGCYTVSTARLAVGREPQRVVALLEKDPNFGTDRLSSAILDFGDVQATMTVSTQAFSRQRVEIVGTGGSLEVHLPFNAHNDVPFTVTVRNELGARDVELPVADQYQRLFEAFGAAVAGEAPFPRAKDDAENNMRVIDAIFESSRTGTWAEVGA